VRWRRYCGVDPPTQTLRSIFRCAVSGVRRREIRESGRSDHPTIARAAPAPVGNPNQKKSSVGLDRAVIPRATAKHTLLGDSARRNGLKIVDVDARLEAGFVARRHGGGIASIPVGRLGIVDGHIRRLDRRRVYRSQHHFLHLLRRECSLDNVHRVRRHKLFRRNLARVLAKVLGACIESWRAQTVVMGGVEGSGRTP
jgi:hypothetical protein